ncbi:ChrR Cupin-like domain family protein [Aspergillus tubingensis]|uniref:ChrR Cupin-like domain family protein n=1 Tax=Aspergillus tubingensis TaxID=5068 RepID=UPI00157803A1|nr:ChrR Cupin-like domain family protein [Aspergillus tubingensis]GFN18562.1 ChrR Cupin-like domain family protein [Aspergillus tubingensis]
MQQSFPVRSESEDRGPLIVIVNGTVTGFAAAIVVLRFISRAAIVKRLGLDDWTMMLATVTAILNVAIAGLGVKYGTGKHDGILPKADALPAAKIRYVTHIIYTLITGLIKTSICLLYLRLFPNLRNITLGTIAFIAAMSIAIILATIFQCSPVDAVYDLMIPKNTTTISVSHLFHFALPIRTILGLQIRQMKRAVVIGLLSLGTFACIASIVRMVYIIKLYESTDPSWSTFGVSVSSGIEVAISIIAASLPSTKPVIDLIFPKLFSTTAKSHTTSGRLYPIQASGRSHRQHDEISLVHLTMECDSGKDNSTTAVSHA